MRPARLPLILAGILACLVGCSSQDSSGAAASAMGPSAGNPVPGAVPTASQLKRLVQGPERPLGGELTILDPFDPGRPYFHDFGTVRYGETRRKTFRLANTGTAPVKLLRALGACSCTRVASVRLLVEGQQAIAGDTTNTEHMLTIPPGEIGEMVVELDTTKTTANRDKLAVLRLATDAEHTPFLMFEIHVLAEKLFDVKQGNVNMGEVAHYGGAGKTIQIFQRMPESLAALVDVVEASEGLQASLEYVNGGALPFWNLTVRLDEELPLGGFQGEVVLSHSGDDGNGDAGRLSVDVYASVVEPIVMHPRHQSFGAVSRGEPKSISANLKTLLPGQRIRVLKASVSGPSAEHIDVNVVPHTNNPDGVAGQFTIKLTASADLPPGKIDAQLRLELDDSQIPLIERPLGGIVR